MASVWGAQLFEAVGRAEKVAPWVVLETTPEQPQRLWTGGPPPLALGAPALPLHRGHAVARTLAPPPARPLCKPTLLGLLQGRNPKRLTSAGAPVAGAARAPPKRVRFVGLDDHTPRPAALPKLTRKGYYTVPSVEALGALQDAELAAVSAFRVGHERHGHIEWSVPLDVRGLDIDALLEFQSGALQLLPGGGPLPGPCRRAGSALITLHACWPRGVAPAHATGPSFLLPIDVQVREAERLRRWEEKLRRRATLMGADFVSFDVPTGTWCFKIPPSAWSEA